MHAADKLGLRSPLARRLILWVVLFSSAVTLVLTALQLYRGYRLDLSFIDDQFRQIERVHVPSLVKNVWATDYGAVQLQLDGLLALRDVRYVEVEDDVGAVTRAGVPTTGDVIAREFPLHYRYRGQDQYVGRMRTVISLEGVYRRLVDTALVALVSNAVKTFLVAGFMLLLFDRLVGRYLAGIARRAESLTLDNLEEAIESARVGNGARPPDEIDALVAALNQMRRGLQESRDALAASELRYRNLFEQAQDGIVIADPSSGRILDANPSMAALTGYSRAELLGTTVVDLAPAGARADAEATLRRVVATGHGRFERLVQHKDGHAIPVEVGVRAVDLAGQPVLIGVIYDMSERRRAEAETLRLGRILDESSNEIYVFRSDTLQFVTANRGALQNLGYSIDELHRLTPLDLKPELTTQAFEKLLYPLRRGTVEQVTSATVHRRKDGTLYPIEVRLHLSRREQPPVFVAMVMDVSERQRAEYEIDGGRRKLDSVVTSAPVVLWAVDRDGLFTLSEGKGLKRLGLVPGEVIGRSVFDVYRDYPNVLAHVRRALAGESFTAEINVTSLWFEVHYAPARDALGRQIGALGVAVDITARRQAEDALRGERDFGKAVLETVASLVVVLDRTGCIVRFNRACERLTGYTFAEVEGRQIWEFLVPPEQAEGVKRVFDNLTAGQPANNYENEWVTRSGARRRIAWSNTILSDWGGAVQFVVAAGADITERRRAEAERERLLAELQARNTEMENFTYTVSHDLKNPLITIGGFAGLLDRDIAAGKLGLAKDSIAEINKAVESLKQHIEDMLMLSRAGRVIADKRPVHLAQLVADVIAPMRKRIEAAGTKISVAPDMPDVLVDEEGFHRVYTNLIDNAVKYRRAGVPPQIDIGWRRNGSMLQLYVRDNGLGIQPQYRERVFVLFQRLSTHTEGTGVGLTISKRVVEAHGGSIGIESEVDRGSTFWISLPESVIVCDVVHPYGLDANTG